MEPLVMTLFVNAIWVKYGLLFLITVVEGPLIMMAAGYAASLGFINFPIAYGFVVVADLVGDSLFYLIGYCCGQSGVGFLARWIKIPPTTADRMKNLYHRNYGKSLILAKITHAAGMPFLVGAGLARIDFRKFILFNFIATLPKALAFLVIGYYFGAAAATIDRYLKYGTWITLALIALLFIAYLSIGRIYYKKLAKAPLVIKEKQPNTRTP